MTQETMNILIADDDAGDRALLKRALGKTGLPYKVTETATIEDALEACEKQAFDCAFIDYRLPGQDGLTGVAAMHERYPTIAIIMASGHGDEVVASEAIKRGASDYIPKANISGESLKRICENAIEKATLRKTIARHEKSILELSTPVLQIREYLLLIPLIGVLDSQRAKHLTDLLVTPSVRKRAEIVIIDITGVYGVDTTVIHYLIEAVTTANLMRAKMIITGVSPELKQSLTALGVDLSRLRMVEKLQDGIEEAEHLFKEVAR